MKIEYLIVLLVCFIVPFALSFSKNLDFYKYPFRLVLSLGIPFILFIAWDIIAAERGHWSFNPDYTIGIKIANLPIEEILFFLIIPFCAVFSWECVKYFTRGKK
ncbi:MAG: lycopene cyclase domain-containing protein [Chlorobi bacterium]|nr:lycopene cyclase domain-containing protein [Chlorobiota bacterium]MCI0716498.1 lycopene cyclase domain-containing protein [Chlorobiota bacterium]